MFRKTLNKLGGFMGSTVPNTVLLPKTEHSVEVQKFHAKFLALDSKGMPTPIFLHISYDDKLNKQPMNKIDLEVFYDFKN